MLRVRIAPSPTGFAHVGTAYTALFNYAFAKSQKGTFIVRIEDTDVARHVKGAEEAIFDGLGWLGISWDEGGVKGGKYGPYRQSEKLDTYRKMAKSLIEKGTAYEDDGAIRFKNPGEDISWEDLIRGKVSFPGGEVTDFVIIKSNGYPTYNFAVVVDDIEMKISHVIRGEEHVSNTPRQLALYKAFEVAPPQFAHHPTLRNKDRKKLSKRRDPVDLKLYKKEGYLPQALVNFLCLLGWSHPENKEIFDLPEFVKHFTLERVRKSGPIFDIQKLDWINNQYIKSLSDAALAKVIFEFFEGKFEKELVKKLTPLIKERISKLSEFESLAGFFVAVPKVDKKLFGKNYKNHLKSAIATIEGVGPWERLALDESLLTAVKANDYKTGDFFMDLRIALTGKSVTPPINDSIMILGKDKTLKRLKKLI